MNLNTEHLIGPPHNEKLYNMKRDLIVERVLLEMQSQDAKHGTARNMHAAWWNTIIGEEFGEVVKASVDSPKMYVIAELIQVAAVAIQYATDLQCKMED